MDLRGIANTVSNAVNPNIIVGVRVSTGSTIGAGLKQVPIYAAPVSGPAQLQALDNSELRQIEGLNLQGVIRGIYLRGVLAGVVRPNQTGGDLIMIGTQTWLVVKVLESWPLWTKAVIVLQVS
jgi:hypothetical protein